MSKGIGSPNRPAQECGFPYRRRASLAEKALAGTKGLRMARIVSLVALVVILLVIAGLFFQVMANFLLPLFLAVLLVVMFGPLNRWFRGHCRGHDRVAAGLTTLSILLMVLAPLLLLLAEAGREAESVYRRAMDQSKSTMGTENAVAIPEVAKLTTWATEQAAEFGKRFGLKIDAQEMEAQITKSVRQFLAPLALRTTQFLGEALVGLAIMVLATYYFFADGAEMVGTIRRLSPLAGNRTQELLDQFDGVTRAVVVATLLSAFVQGLLAGIGYYVAGVGSVFLLTALSMLLTLVPFVGAAMVWVPVCLWLYVVEARTMAAVVLAAYCVGVVSTVDNLVKPLVLHGRSNLHPLLALLSVLGGAQALGPIGIFVGPMVVAFLQTLLNMVHAELKGITGGESVASVSQS
jgi:predicted PurR-regulated permease PerM